MLLDRVEHLTPECERRFEGEVEFGVARTGEFAHVGAVEHVEGERVEARGLAVYFDTHHGVAKTQLLELCCVCFHATREFLKEVN